MLIILMKNIFNIYNKLKSPLKYHYITTNKAIHYPNSQ